MGRSISLDLQTDYAHFHCLTPEELKALLNLLHEEGYIGNSDEFGYRNPQVLYESDIIIKAKGYRRLQELRKTAKDSRQCFVAMWLAPEMTKVYEDYIKPAIEYVEEGQSEPKFRALRIDNVEHINDINDEIIAAIRRSRFMVCDLTGYRGGVYFEAGFAYGLGLDVIYTCRKDWTKGELLKTDKGEEIRILYDRKGREIEVKKEGVHFDLEHRNRIEWDENNLDEFREKLTNRIKAIIT